MSYSRAGGEFSFLLKQIYMENNGRRNFRRGNYRKNMTWMRTTNYNLIAKNVPESINEFNLKQKIRGIIHYAKEETNIKITVDTQRNYNWILGRSIYVDVGRGSVTIVFEKDVGEERMDITQEKNV